MSQLPLEQLDRTDYPATWGVGATIFWSITLAILFIATQFAVMIAYINWTYGPLDPKIHDKVLREIQSSGLVISLCTFATTVVCCTLIIAIIKLKDGANIRHYLALNFVPLKTLAYWLIAIFAFILASDTLTYLLGRPIVPEFMSNAYQTTQPIWLLWLALIVAAPLFEEFMFRGFLITGLSNTKLGNIGAIITSAFLWAIIHLQYDLYGISTIVIMGLLFGYARIRTNSLYIPIILHAFSNLIATIEASIF